MTDISLNASKFTIPISITAATLMIATLVDSNNRVPAYYHSIPKFQLTDKAWEEQYIPKSFSDDYSKKIKIIHRFALNLVQNSEDIPADFAEVINEDFWDII